MTPRCAWCEHDVPGDLVRSADAHGNLILECRASDFCDLRAYMRGLHLGVHLERVQ